MLALNEIKQAIADVVVPYGIAKATLFGSYARGEQSANSDVDLVVELNRPLGFKRAELIESLQTRLGTTVDLIFGKSQLYGPVRDTYERDKVVLYEA